MVRSLLIGLLWLMVVGSGLCSATALAFSMPNNLWLLFAVGLPMAGVALLGVWGIRALQRGRSAAQAVESPPAAPPASQHMASPPADRHDP